MKILLKSIVVGMQLVKENTYNEVLHEEIFSKEF